MIQYRIGFIKVQRLVSVNQQQSYHENPAT